MVRMLSGTLRRIGRFETGSRNRDVRIGPWMNTRMSDVFNELKKLYDACPQRDMGTDLLYYAEHGYVFSSPFYLLIGKRIGDGWHIHVAIGAGCFEKFCQLMPYWLPYVGWAREQKQGRSEVVWHRTEDVFRKVGYTYGRSCSETTAATCGPKSVDGIDECKNAGRGSEETEGFLLDNPWSG